MKRIALILPWLADFGHGIILTILITYLFGIEPTGFHFLMGLLFSISPDLDGIRELFKYGNVAAHEGREHDHRDGLHFPLLWILIGSVVIFINPFWGTFFLSCVMLHFFNDSWGTGFGVEWLWPFSRNNYKLFPNKVVDDQTPGEDYFASWSPEEKVGVMKKYGNPNWINDLYLKPTIISVVEYSTFIVAVLILIIFYVIK